MTAQALALTDLCPFANDEPRIQDLRVAERLGMSRARDIRKDLIKPNELELLSYGILREAPANSEAPRGRGRPGKEYWLNEGQVLVICMLSRTPQAAQVRKEVIDVFMAYRRGLLTGEIAQAANDALPHAPPAGLSPKAQRLWSYMAPLLSADLWRPLSMHDMWAGTSIRYGALGGTIAELADRNLLQRRHGPSPSAPHEYRLSPILHAAPKVPLAIPEGHAVVKGHLIDMTAPSYRKGERVAVRLLDGSLGLYTLLDDAPLQHFVMYHRLGWVGCIDLGIKTPEGYGAVERAMVIGRVVAPEAQRIEPRESTDP